VNFLLINNTPFTVDLNEILNELRSQLHKKGLNLLKDIREVPDNVMVTCPYHKGGQERKPSAGIKKADGTFHCFTCGETHTLPEMISHCFGHNDMIGSFGWEWLLKNFLTVSFEERKDISLDFGRNKVVQEQSYVTEDVLDSFREYHSYMWTRKMTPEVVEIFDVGYDKESRCITFPVRDIKGNCLFVARRSVVTKFFNYPAGAEKPVYGLYELHQLPKFPSEVIICESMIDAITCWVYGKYAVALNGLGNELQFRQLNAMPCRKFILATDNDDAGQAARKRLRKNIRNKLITEYIFPIDKKDINDLTLEEFNNLEEIF
jgi:DNA primase